MHVRALHIKMIQIQCQIGYHDVLMDILITIVALSTDNVTTVNKKKF